MTRRKKIIGVAGLFRNEETGNYFLRRSVAGKEVERSLKTKNLKKAKTLIEGKLDEVKAEFKESPRIKFEIVGEAVKEIMSTKSEKTFVDFEGHYRLHLLPYFRGKYMDQVGALWEHYKATQKRLNPKRKLKHDAAHLRRMLRYARTQKALSDVPELPLDAADREVETGRVYTAKEYRKLWRAADPKWKLILEMAAIMGMRRGEIRNLRWEYIDFRGGVIRLPTRATKTRRARTVPVDPGVLDALRKLEPLIKSDWVFPNRRDETLPMNPTDRTWRRIQKRAGVKGKFHWLRHSNVSWALRAGFAAKIVQKTRGMSSQVMERVYTHADDEDAARMNAAIRGFLDGESEE